MPATQTVVGVNKYRVPAEQEMEREALKPPPRKKIDAQLRRLTLFKAGRNQGEVRRALDALARAAESQDENVYEKVVEAACAERHARRDLRRPAQGLRLRPAADRAVASALQAF